MKGFSEFRKIYSWCGFSLDKSTDKITDKSQYCIKTAVLRIFNKYTFKILLDLIHWRVQFYLY